jgi:hypothetical protein
MSEAESDTISKKHQPARDEAEEANAIEAKARRKERHARWGRAVRRIKLKKLVLFAALTAAVGQAYGSTSSFAAQAWPKIGEAAFPTAEQAVAKEGLDPKLVQLLAPGKRIYVRTDTLPGTAHALFDNGLRGAYPNWRYRLHNPNIGAYTHRIQGPHGYSCGIYLHTANYAHKQSQNIQQALLHEIRHCSDANAKFTGLMAEADADAKAIEVLSAAQKMPGLAQLFINAKARSPGDTDHDDVLYLDAVFNHRPIPTAEQMQAANREANGLQVSLALRDAELSLSDAQRAAGQRAACDDSANQKICNFDLAQQGLSPLGLRRAQLYENARPRPSSAAPAKVAATPAKPKTKPA